MTGFSRNFIFLIVRCVLLVFGLSLWLAGARYRHIAGVGLRTNWNVASLTTGSETCLAGILSAENPLRAPEGKSLALQKIRIEETPPPRLGKAQAPTKTVFEAISSTRLSFGSDSHNENRARLEVQNPQQWPENAIFLTPTEALVAKDGEIPPEIRKRLAPQQKKLPRPKKAQKWLLWTVPQNASLAIYGRVVRRDTWTTLLPIGHEAFLITPETFTEAADSAARFGWWLQSIGFVCCAIVAWNFGGALRQWLLWRQVPRSLR